MSIEKVPKRNLHVTAKLNKIIRFQKTTSAQKTLERAKKKIDFIQSVELKLVGHFLGAIRNIAVKPVVRIGSIMGGGEPIIKIRKKKFNKWIEENQASITVLNRILQEHGKTPLTNQELTQIFYLFIKK